MSYTILTGNAVESARILNTRWAPAGNLMSVGTMARGGLRHHLGDVFYTEAALEALVRSAAVEGKAWQEWHAFRHAHAGAIRPYEAWEYLYEESLESLAARGRSRLARLDSVVHVPADRPSLSYVDLINFERRHQAAAVRAKAADHLIRIAPGRVLVTEAQYGGVVEIRASWTALHEDQRKAPGWLIDASQLDNGSSKLGALAL